MGWISGLFEKDAEKLTENYKSAEREWLNINGDSDAAKEIRKIQQQIGLEMWQEFKKFKIKQCRK